MMQVRLTAESNEPYLLEWFDLDTDQPLSRCRAFKIPMVCLCNDKAIVVTKHCREEIAETADGAVVHLSRDGHVAGSRMRLTMNQVQCGAKDVVPIAPSVVMTDGTVKIMSEHRSECPDVEDEVEDQVSRSVFCIV